MSRVFLGNLPSDCRVRDIEDFFREFGKVRNVLIKHGKFGFAEFDRDRDADDAVHEQHGRSLLGSRIVVEHAKGPRGPESSGRRAPWVSKYGAPMRTKYRLRIENLSTGVGWQDLKDTLRRGGEVTYAEAHTRREREGLVQLATREDMERILKRYQGYDMNGREIKLIKDCDSSKSRSRSPSRRAQSSRSRSKRNSRSRSGGSRSRQNSLSGRKPSRSLSRSRRRSISRSRSKSGRSRSGKDKGRAKSQSERSSRSGSRHTLERGASGDEKRLDGVSLVEKA